AVAAAGQMHWHDVGDPVESWHALIDIASLSLVALGLGWILHQRDRERMIEIVLDGGLVLTAATVLTLRWSPAAHNVLSGTVDWPLPERIGAFAAPIAA